jgi:hypothetical protein
MRARGSAPREKGTGTGTTSRPSTKGTRPAPSCPPPAARTQHDERHDHDGHPAHDPDAWIQELAAAAPPLTRQQRHTLALFLRNPVPARPAGAAGPDQTP